MFHKTHTMICYSVAKILAKPYVRPLGTYWHAISPWDAASGIPYAQIHVSVTFKS
jgi:hypothetical protein